MTLSDGEFNNSGNLQGTITISGGRFKNKAGGAVNSTITMNGGTFNNSGTVNALELNGGTFDMKSGGSVEEITMTGGTLKNSTGEKLTLTINGQSKTLENDGSFTENDFLPVPEELKWTQMSEKRDATATWGTVSDAASYTVKLYKGSNPIAETTGITTTTADFTDKIIDGGYGDYYFTVQATSTEPDKIASPIVTSDKFEYKGPSNEIVTTDNYTWDYLTQTLTIKTNDGSLGWKSDTKILGTLITDSSYNIVKHAVIGPRISYLKDSMLPCPELEDLIIQSGAYSFTIHDKWAKEMNTSATVFHKNDSLSHFDGKVVKFECLIRGIEEGEVFQGRVPNQFTVYGTGTVEPLANSLTYMQIQSWKITKDGSEISSGTFDEENPENTYTVNSEAMKLNPTNYGEYTLTVTYQPKRWPLNGANWENNDDPKSISVNFTLAPEVNEEPGPIYPPSQYTITSSADEGGTITPEGSTRVYAGLSAAFAIAPKEGYLLKDVLVDGASVGAVTEYTFERVYGNHTIHAVFEKEQEPAEPDNPDNPDNPGKPTDPDKPSGDKPNNKPENPNTPKTGDENNLLFYLLLAGAAGGAAVTLNRKRRNSR